MSEARRLLAEYVRDSLEWSPWSTEPRNCNRCLTYRDEQPAHQRYCIVPALERIVLESAQPEPAAREAALVERLTAMVEAKPHELFEVKELARILAGTSPAAAALLAQGEEMRKIVAILRPILNLTVVQVPPPIVDHERLYALKDAVAAFDRAALAPGEEKA